MNRVSLSSNTNTNRGVALTAEALLGWFPVATVETGYISEMNGASTFNQKITLEAKTIWGYDFINGGALLNKQMTKKYTDRDGMEQTFETSSAKDMDQTISILLQKKDFGTAVAKNKEYTGKDSAGKAALADWIFGTRTFLTEWYASFTNDARAMRNLVVDKAMSLGLITSKSQAIDFKNEEIKAYWAAEIAPRFEDLKNKYSMKALIADGNSPFKGAVVYRKDGSFTPTYTLYLG